MNRWQVFSTVLGVIGGALTVLGFFFIRTPVLPVAHSPLNPSGSLSTSSSPAASKREGPTQSSPTGVVAPQPASACQSHGSPTWRGATAVTGPEPVGSLDG